MTFLKSLHFKSLKSLWRGAGEIFAPLGKKLLIATVLAYKSLPAFWMGGACRFQPSCSDYALEALEKHSPLKAAGMILKRIIRCRPFGSFGYDPVSAPATKR
ncbi:MAG: membrane protein insertion efficiency factor YidD [Bdellovibrionales bacterium]